MSVLKGFNNLFESTLNNQIQDNLIEFLDWGLLEKGNYFNVTLGELSPTNEDYSLLKISNNTNFSSGSAWDGFRPNWIWQSGISFDPQPIVGVNNTIPGISGIYVNDNFYPSDTTGPYSHYIDYYNGRVVFNNPIPTGSKVQAEYSYKYINVIYANSLPWLKEIQYNNIYPINSNNLPEMEIQLPSIAIEIVPKRSFKPLQLGGGQIIYTDILFHCIAQDDYTRNTLTDIISFQNDRSIYFFDINRVISSGEKPINYLGYPNSGALSYPKLLEKYTSLQYNRLINTNIQDIITINSNLYLGIVKTTLESHYYNI